MRKKEKDGTLPIFDIQLIRQEIATTVYRKSSASDRYIHYTSWQAWKEKSGAIRTLKNRAYTYCSDEQLLAEELSYLLEVFVQNGYPEKVVYRILYDEKKPVKLHQQSDKKTDFANVFYVPYNWAKRLYKILQEQFGITTIFKKTTTLGNLIKKKGKQKDSSHQTRSTKSLAKNVTNLILGNPRILLLRECHNTRQYVEGM